MEISVDPLKRDWEQLHPLDRAEAVARIRRSGISIRQIARQVGRSEATLRRLLVTLNAPAADLLLARQDKLSINELVRRAKAEAARRDAERQQDLETRRAESAKETAILICNWLAEEGVYGPDGERIIDDVRAEFAKRELYGNLPTYPSEVPILSVQELIRRARPTQPRPDDATSIDWYHAWLFRWTFYAFPDTAVRDRALELALEAQWRR